MTFKSPRSFLIAALIAALVIFSPVIITAPSSFISQPFSSMIRLGNHTVVYIGTLLALLLIFKIDKPKTEEPTYGPKTEEPSYGPKTEEPTYGPKSEEPTYGPKTEEPTYGP